MGREWKVTLTLATVSLALVGVCRGCHVALNDRLVMHGRILDVSGRPVSGVRVTVERTYLPLQIPLPFSVRYKRDAHTATSDGDGRLAFDLRGAVLQVVRMEKSGWTPDAARGEESVVSSPPRPPPGRPAPSSPEAVFTFRMSPLPDHPDHGR